MNPFQLIAQMLPLIIFLIVDMLFNNVRISILSAMAFAAVQLIMFYVKTGRFDWFVFVDVALIAGLGTVSIISKNDLFFKVKPAVIEGATIVFFLVLFFLPDRVLTGYFGRMLPKGMALNPAAIAMMKPMLLIMSVYVLVHIGAVLYTAFHASRKVWAFVSGPGFFLFFIPVMAVLYFRSLRRRRKNTSRTFPMEFRNSSPKPGTGLSVDNTK
jgi:intracellular septation protein